MNIATISAGVGVIALGCYFLWRSLHPESASRKLKGMMDAWGQTRGIWIYRIFYAGVPWFLGAMMIWAGLRNVSLGAFFKV